MADYIDRQKIIETIHSAIYPFFCGAEDGDILSEDEKLVLSVNKTICTAIKAFPSADVQPVRHGHWIERESGTEDKENGFETVIVCSHCDFPATTFYSEDCESRTQIRTDFCPNCGARMDGE